MTHGLYDRYCDCAVTSANGLEHRLPQGRRRGRDRLYLATQKHNMSAAKTCVFLWTFASLGFVLAGADSCSNNPCQHDGLCINKDDSFVCRCRRSYSGPTCGQEIDPCRQHPCRNGGTCFPISIAGRGLFTCQCLRGYTGKRCGNSKKDIRAAVSNVPENVYTNVLRSFPLEQTGLKLRSYTGELIPLAGAKTTYKAAVFDQSPTYLKDTSIRLSRPEAVKFLTTTLDVFEKQCQKAHKENVDIIVFPEYGLAPGLLVVRDVMRPFLEQVPDPQKVKWNPCVNPNKYPDTEFQQRLSCMAKRYKLFLVANMGSLEPCSSADDTDCPTDGRYQYNTNVAYDSEGFLVAKYRKHHPFYLESATYDKAKMIDYAAFKTPFGNFGTFICFDILFHEPTISLIEKWNIDSIAFPTAWVNVLPYFSAVPFHGSFATGKGVNFLASNLHIPLIHATGTGIYTPGKTKVYRNPMTESGSKLLISTLPVKPRRIKYKKVTFPANMDTKADFSSDIFGDTYNYAELPGKKGVASVCSGKLCCRVAYRYKTKATDEYYAFAAFDGLHLLEGTYYIQMCLLLKCGNMSRSSCGSSVTEASTKFSYLSISGNFSTPYVYPSLVTSGVNPSSGEFTYNGKRMVSHGTKKGLLTAVFLARKYDLDIKKKPKRSNKYLKMEVERALADPAVLQRDFLTVL